MANGGTENMDDGERGDGRVVESNVSVPAEEEEEELEEDGEEEELEVE